MDYIWSDSPAHTQVDSQWLPLGVSAALGVGVFAAASRGPTDQFRGIDAISATARFAGNLSPFQLYNTFRVPHILSPFTSTKFKSSGFTDSGPLSASGVFTWDKEYLQSGSTYDWLKHVTGLSPEELSDRGIRREMVGEPSKLAEKLTWEPLDKKGSRGVLSSWVGGQKHELSREVMLMAAADEQLSPALKDRGLNRIMTGMFAAANMQRHETFDENAVFKAKGGDRAQFMPIPSLSGGVDSVEAIGRRTNYLRGIAAFEMDRFNRLVGDLGEAVLGDTGKRISQYVIGVDPKVRGGPASAQFARFGIRAAGTGAAALAVGEIDWIRRQYGMPGNVIASGLTSMAVGYAAQRFTGSPRLALTAGVASFAGQTILPGFDQGIIQGLSTTWTNIDILRGSQYNPFHYWRRTVEGFMPGGTDWTTGALLGAAGGVLTAAKMPFGIGRIPEVAFAKFGSQLTSGGLTALDIEQANRSVRDEFWKSLSEAYSTNTKVMPHHSMTDRMKLLLGRFSAGKADMSTFIETMSELNLAWSKAEDTVFGLAENNKINQVFSNRLEQIALEYSGKDTFSILQKNILGFVEQAKYGFLGANTSDKAVKEVAKNFGFVAPIGRAGRVATVSAAIFGAHQLFLGGMFGSLQTAEELQAIYSGEEFVEIKRSRWWEAGGTPFEGDETSYFRPHAHALLMNRVRQSAIWGEDEDRRSPIQKFLLKNFTYTLEKENYYSRPYPISSAAFSDVPIIGPILGGTIGQLIKPPRLMHTGEWISETPEGRIQFGTVSQGQRDPAYSLGAIPPGIPQSPFGPSEQLAWLSYQFRELEGMTGWAKNVLQSQLGHSELWNVDTPVLADAGRMTSMRHEFWEAELGGLMFMNEAVRRVFPNEPSEKDIINPIANNMPSWMPEKFRHGDPYLRTTWGSVRMPGPGYAALRKELRGIDPEDYPDIYKYEILSGAAPASKEYFEVKERVYQARASGFYDSRQEQFIDQIDRRYAKQMNAYNFERIHENAIELPGSQITQALWFGGQDALRTTAAPFEYLIPMGFRPVQKLLANRDPIEQYEFNRMYGTPMAFWDKLYRDWMRPSLYSAMNMMGYTGKPAWRVDADETNAYFDKLEFVKWMELAANAEGRDRKEYLRRAQQTRHGVNPQGSPLAIYWSLPDAERKFFNAFVEASGADRKRIREMIPSDQVHLYEHLWARKDRGDYSLYLESDQVIDDQYLAAQYASAKSFLEARGEVPREDWIGWHEDVHMDDIKVRYIHEQGKDIHDFQMWNNNLKRSMRQPFLEGATRPIARNQIGTASAIKQDMFNMLGLPGQQPRLSVVQTGNMLGSSSIDYYDDRTPVLANIVQGVLNGI